MAIGRGESFIDRGEKNKQGQQSAEAVQFENELKEKIGPDLVEAAEKKHPQLAETEEEKTE